MPVKNETLTNESEEKTNEPQTVQEITLTDKLNKRLLQSFLTRLNQGEIKFDFTEENDTKKEDDDSNSFE